MSPVTHQLAEECMRMNLEKEVQRVFGDASDNEGLLLFDQWKAGNLADNLLPEVSFATDMSWQGRSSGRTHNSLSGHTLLIGGVTRLSAVLHEYQSKKCNYCTHWNRHNGVDEEPPEHDCTLNFEGASGAMEPVAVLHMVVDVKNGNEVPRPDKGELPADMKEPTFLADPSHRKKSLKNIIYTLISKTKEHRLGCSKMDAIHIGTNFAHMSRSLPNKPESEFVDAGKAVIEHHFDCHAYCSDWCRRKPLTDDQRQASTKFYRCKTKDKKLYEWLQEKLARFLTLDALKEVGHGMDALVNESFNNTAAWLAPKNKVYSGSLSLRNRIDVAIIITTLGLKVFYERILQGFGIPITEDIKHFVNIINNKRDKRIAKTKTNDAKKARQLKFHEKLKAHTEDAAKNHAKADGTYQPGIGMDGGYVEGDFTNNNKRKRTPAASNECPLCHLKGHKTRRSKKCKYNKENPNYVGDDAVADLNRKEPATAEAGTLASTDEDGAAQLDRDAKECDVMDNQPLEDSGDDAFWSAEEYNSQGFDSDSDDTTQHGAL